MPKERKIPPFLQVKSNLLFDRRIKKLNSEMPNGQGLGLFFGLKFMLLNEPGQKCYLDDLTNIAYDLRTSTPLLMTIITSYNLFAIDEDENGKKFFCPLLNEALEPYFKICETNKINALIGVEKKKLKALQQIKDLRNKLSDKDSGERPQSNRNANVNNVGNINNIKDETNYDFLNTMGENQIKNEIAKEKREEVLADQEGIKF